jgi:hypothetical protein
LFDINLPEGRDMPAKSPVTASERTVAFGGLIVVVLLYALYLALPVVPEPYGGPNAIRGYEGLPICFVLAPLWPIAVGHVLLWVGVVLLGLRYWRSAALLGLVALFVSVVYVVGMLPGYFAKLASMATLVATGGFGWFRFGRRALENAGAR